MLTRPLSLNDSDDRGHGLVAVTPHPTLQLADEGDDDDTKTSECRFFLLLFFLFVYINILEKGH